MCFTFAGRVQTRLMALVGPALLAGLLATIHRDPDYWKLFGVMAVVGLILDVGVYGWLITYQPRWVSVLLAVVEFLIVKWVVEWPYPLEIRLRTRQALMFYMPAWILSWATIQALLPTLFVRWAEDGGELVRLPLRLIRNAAARTSCQAGRRRSYLSAAALLALAASPWLAAALRTPPGQHFTGLLIAEGWHLDALTAATAAAHDTGAYTLVGLIGGVARALRWPPLGIYWMAWGAAAFAWLLGLWRLVAPRGRGGVLAITAGCLPILVLPAPWLFTLSLVVWLGALVPWQRYRQLATGMRRLAAGLSVLALGVWLFAWLRIPAAPLAYVSEADWQALAWLRQSAPAEQAVSAEAPLLWLVPALGGHPTSRIDVENNLRFAAGDDCDGGQVLFRNADVCVVASSAISP